MYLKHLIQIIFSPRRGWEDASYAAVDPRRLRRGLFWLVLVSALTCYVPILYARDLSLLQMTAQAAIVAIKYAISYFILPVIVLLYLPSMSDDKYSNMRLDTLTAYTLGYFALVRLIVNCLPAPSSVTDFLPFYAIAIIWQSDKYMNIQPRHALSYAIATSAIMILTPWLIGLAISLFL